MKCFFLGHKFGPVQGDGYQYCGTCGTAQKPTVPPKCSLGHVWTVESSLPYTGYYSTLSGGVEWKDVKLSEVCETCGVRRSIWQFGH